MASQESSYLGTAMLEAGSTKKSPIPGKVTAVEEKAIYTFPDGTKFGSTFRGLNYLIYLIKDQTRSDKSIPTLRGAWHFHRADLR
jgi:hypothetical protein